MVELTRSKRFTKRKTKYSRAYNKSQKQLQLNISSTMVWAIIILIIFIFGISIIFKYTLFQSENYITQLDYNIDTIKQYDNPELYTDISNALVGKNFYTYKRRKFNNLRSNIMTKYGIIQNILIEKNRPYSALIDIQFHEPDIIIEFREQQFGIIGSYIFEIGSGSNIGQGVSVIELPQYLSGINNIDGIFFDIGAEKFKADINQIQESFPQADRIVYLPGALTSIVFVYGKMVYINHQNKIIPQIKNFYTLDKHYDGFENLRIIDLGSFDIDKIIVK